MLGIYPALKKQTTYISVGWFLQNQTHVREDDQHIQHWVNLHRKEEIQPHLPIRLPCYDFTPITDPTLGGWLLTVASPTSGVANSRGVTGVVDKARKRIHRGMLIRDY